MAIDSPFTKEANNGCYSIPVGLIACAGVAVKKEERLQLCIVKDGSPQTANSLTIALGGIAVDGAHIVENLCYAVGFSFGIVGCCRRNKESSLTCSFKELAFTDGCQINLAKILCFHTNRVKC